jgi:hypothetical protein
VSLAYEIVRGLGVFRDRGIIAGAVCVGFVHHCFYEVFDQLGPHLHWWAWNDANPINHPMLSSVPMTSVFIFATLGPIVVTALVLRLVAGSHRTARTVLAGALVPVGIAVLSIPTSLFGGPHPHTGVQAVLFSIELVAIAAFALPVLIQQARRVTVQPNGFVLGFGTAYLLVLAMLWITSHGTPKVGAGYAAVCFVIAAWTVSLPRLRFRSRDDTGKSTVDHPRSKTGQGQTNSTASRFRSAPSPRR